MITRTRVLTASMLEERLARLSEPFDSCYGDSNPGLAECRSYDRDDAREKLARVRAGETVTEGWDTTYARWQDV